MEEQKNSKFESEMSQEEFERKTALLREDLKPLTELTGDEIPSSIDKDKIDFGLTSEMKKIMADFKKQPMTFQSLREVDLKQYNQVAEFMEVMGQHSLSEPGIPDNKVIHLRHALIHEENKELQDAAIANDIIEVVDALCDLEYVLKGAMKAYGIGAELFQECFDEVHASNMSKTCATREEAELSIDALYTIAIENDKEAEFHYEEIAGKFIIFSSHNRKVVKPLGYFKPDLKSILIKHGVNI